MESDVLVVLCQDLGLVRGVNLLEGMMMGGKVEYYRLYGERNYRHQYSNEELAKLRELNGNEAYVLFNNSAMYHNVLRFKELIESRE